MKINKLITKKNYTNASRTKSNIKFIVIHYVGATGGAEANCKYYASAMLYASAHYFVGFAGEVWQSVLDEDIAWHCGTSGKYKHATCRNSNSIGIEMCVRKDSKGKWYFEQATVDKTIELTKELMKKYGITATNVIRHHDVTGKICGEPFVRDVVAWNEFRSALKTTTAVKAPVKTTPVAKPAVNVVKCPYTVPDSKVNSKNEWKFVQWQLNNLTNAGLSVDGINGPKTKDAIKDYQSLIGVAITGVPSVATINAMVAGLGMKCPYAVPNAKVDTRDDWRYIQWNLNKLISSKLVVDGYTGTKTKAAIKKYQPMIGLAASGNITAATLTAIKAGKLKK